MRKIRENEGKIKRNKEGRKIEQGKLLRNNRSAEKVSCKNTKGRKRCESCGAACGGGFNIYMDGCIREMKVGVWDLGARLNVRDVEQPVVAGLYVDDTVLLAEGEGCFRGL